MTTATLFICQNCKDEESYEIFLENQMPCDCGGIMEVVS